MKLKKIFAVIILTALFFSLTATIVVGVFMNAPRLLFALLFTDIVLPVVVYAYTVITRQIKAMDKDEDVNE